MLKGNEARYKLVSNLAVWCAASGAAAGGTAASAVAWLNAAPGVGTLLDLGVGAATALFVDIECSLSHLTEWNAAKASWENKHFQDITDCNSNFNCGF